VPCTKRLTPQMRRRLLAQRDEIAVSEPRVDDAVRHGRRTLNDVRRVEVTQLLPNTASMGARPPLPWPWRSWRVLDFQFSGLIGRANHRDPGL
jgi:hypothetical protein